MSLRPSFPAVRFLLFLLILTQAARAPLCAYVTPPPRYINVTVDWTDPTSGEQHQVNGQLIFDNYRFPALIRGETGIESLRRWDVKSFVPQRPGEITIVQTDDRSDGHVWHEWRHYRGNNRFRFPYASLPLVQQAEALLDQAMLEHAGGAAADLVDDDGPGAFDESPDLDADAILDIRNIDREPGTRDQQDTDDNDNDDEPSGMRLAVHTDPGYREIPTAAITSISFLTAADGYRFETYTGRYVQYSNAARGDDGRVQVMAATYFGGEDEERFEAAAFMADGSIMMVASTRDLDFLGRSVRQRVLGQDGNLDMVPRAYYRTPTMVHYSADLSRIVEIVRLPWGTGRCTQAFFGPDDALYLVVAPGPTMPGFFAGLRNTRISGHERGGGLHHFLLRISPDRSRVDWAVKFRHGGFQASLYPDNRIAVRQHTQVYLIDQRRGTVSDGPTVITGGGRVLGRAIHPVTGAFYFGGEYHNATGLEPWRNPWLRKFDSDGNWAWTAYDWTGPIVGVAQLRLVSDSRVEEIRIGADGNLLFSGWSDGGNSVFTRQPYDLRKPVPSSGWCNSIWGARVLSVPYLIRMDAETQEVYGMTRYMSYLPTSNIPNSARIGDFTTTESGEVAVTGGSAFSFVETWDAWVEPWYIQHRKDEFATGKGGTFFTLFTADMRRPRIATIVPGISNPQLATRGRYILLYGSARTQSQHYAHRLDTIIRNAIQPEHGGGAHDAYVMLIDTQGEPNPPEIPEWQWNHPSLRRRR